MSTLFGVRLCSKWFQIFPERVGRAGGGKDHAIGALDLLSSSNNAVYKSVLLSEDLSNGLENVPIRCVMDGDVMEPCTCSLCTGSGSLTPPGGSQPWNNFVYITKRHLDPSLGLDTKVCVWSPCALSLSLFLSGFLQELGILKYFVFYCVDCLVWNWLDRALKWDVRALEISAQRRAVIMCPCSTLTMLKPALLMEIPLEANLLMMNLAVSFLM